MPLLSDKLSADGHGADDPRALHVLDGHDDLAIIEQQRVTPGHIVGQPLVGDADTFCGARVGFQGGVEDKALAFRERPLVQRGSD